MNRTAATFLCLALASAVFASAPDSPVRAEKQTTAVAPAVAAVAKAGKADRVAAKGSAAAAPETFRDPYATPLLLNAKPLMTGRP